MSEGSALVSAGRGVSYLWLQSISSSAARVIAFAFFARLISVNQMGLYTILSLASGAASVLMGLGMFSVVTKFVAENMAQGRRKIAASVCYKSLLLSEVASVTVAAGIVLSKFPAGVSNLSYSPVISAITVLFAVDILASVGPTAAAGFYGLLKFRDYALMYGIYASVKPFIVVLLVYVTGSLVGLVEGWLISDSVLAVCVFAYFWRMLGPPTFGFNAKYLLKLSIPLYVADIASFLYGSIDQLTLIPLVSLGALGIYGAAVAAFGAYNGLIGVLGTVLLPVFSSVHGLKGSRGLEESIWATSRYVSIAAMPLAFAFLASTRPTLTLLVGVPYEAGVVPLAVLVLGSIANIVGLAFSPVLIILNETTFEALTSILPLPLSVAVALISIPMLGIVGASIARGLSMVLSLVLTWYFVGRRISVKLDFRAIFKSMAASAFMALVMESLQVLFYSRFLLPVYLAVGLIAYLLGMRALKAIRTDDINLLRSILGPHSGRMCDLLSRLAVVE